jgi:hypothetical protein
MKHCAAQWCVLLVHICSSIHKLHDCNQILLSDCYVQRCTAWTKKLNNCKLYLKHLHYFIRYFIIRQAYGIFVSICMVMHHMLFQKIRIKQKVRERTPTFLTLLNKLNSYQDMTCKKITEFFRWYSFKSFAKQNNDSNKTCRYVHDLLLYQTLFV